jgi:uncharacterized protein (TIGR00255 family)
VPVYSMTGYATLNSGSTSAETPIPAVLGVEIRSVNSRFLDLTFKMGDELRGAEPALRELFGQQLRRGKVECRAWIEGKADQTLRMPSTAELQRLVAIQDSVCAWLPKAEPLSVNDVMQWVQHLQPVVSGQLHDILVSLAHHAVQALKEARAKEGARLATMLHGHTAHLRALAKNALPLVPQVVEQQRLRFLERWKEALGQAASLADQDMARDRALAEATSFAIRVDVAEELTRLMSHLDEIDHLLEKGGELGKRLDFLIQELHREANTLGSKASGLELTRISVDMKVLIEQMREQVQNIE